MTERRRHRESDAELAFKGAVVSIVLVGLGVWVLTRPAPSGSPYAPILGAFTETLRPIGWLGVAVGLLAGTATAFLWWRIVQRRQALARTGLTRADLQRLSPTEFERWCAARLREQGYAVQDVGGQGDHGIDLIAERDAQRTVVQCKRWTSGRIIGEPQIRDLYGAMHDAIADRAMVITTGLFTEAARAWANNKPILLWDVERLVGHARPAEPTQVARPETAPACQRCGRDMVRRVNRTDGTAFWGCSGYPACTNTRPL